MACKPRSVSSYGAAEFRRHVKAARRLQKNVGRRLSPLHILAGHDGLEELPDAEVLQDGVDVVLKAARSHCHRNLPKILTRNAHNGLNRPNLGEKGNGPSLLFF